MQVIKLEALLMDNDEVLYMGRTLGFVSDDEKAVSEQRGRHLLISRRHISEVREPQDV